MYLCTMQNNKRFLLSAAWVLSLHILTLLFLSLFRLVEYMALGSMVSDTSASVVPAFIRGVWFDNVIACYISVVPLTLTLLPASVLITCRWMRKNHRVVVRPTWLYCLYGVGSQYSLLCLFLQEHQLVYIRVVWICWNNSRHGYWREILLPVHCPVFHLHGTLHIYYGAIAPLVRPPYSSVWREQ